MLFVLESSKQDFVFERAALMTLNMPFREDSRAQHIAAWKEKKKLALGCFSAAICGGKALV